jgi:hypothetical protein
MRLFPANANRAYQRLGSLAWNNGREFGPEGVRGSFALLFGYEILDLVGVRRCRAA